MQFIIDNLFIVSLAFLIVVGFFSWFGKSDREICLRTVKLVHPHPEDSKKIVLRASNPNFKGDTPICINDIVNMYIVKGKITRSQL